MMGLLPETRGAFHPLVLTNLKHMKKLVRNSTHFGDKSHDCLIADIGGIKVKMTYEAYNAVERFSTEFFDPISNKWNHILSIHDLGEPANKYAFQQSNVIRKERCDDLILKSEIICKKILQKTK